MTDQDKAEIKAIVQEVTRVGFANLGKIIEQSTSALSDRMTALEQRMGTVEQRMTGLEKTMREMREEPTY